MCAHVEKGFIKPVYLSFSHQGKVSVKEKKPNKHTAIFHFCRYHSEELKWAKRLNCLRITFANTWWYGPQGAQFYCKWTEFQCILFEIAM